MGEAKRRKLILKEKYGQVTNSWLTTFTIILPEKIDSKYHGENKFLTKIFNEMEDKPEGFDIDGRILIPFKIQGNEKEYDILLALETKNLASLSSDSFVLKGLLYCGFGLSVLGKGKESQINKAKEIKIEIFNSVLQLIGGGASKRNIVNGIRLPRITVLATEFIIF